MALSLREAAVVGACLLLPAMLAGQADWGTDRLLLSGTLAQYGIAADRTPGPDTVFAGAIRRTPDGEIINLFRSVDRGGSWSLIWQAAQTSARLSNLALKTVAGVENWVCLFWIANDGQSNGDVWGVRVPYDGSTAEYLHPTVAGAPDTIRWLCATRSSAPACTLYLFWQDERGLAGVQRDPAIRMSGSTDFGLSWSEALEVLTGAETPAADCGAPGYLYLAARRIGRQDIMLAQTTDGGQNWIFSLITTDSTAGNDMFPSVAASHDSAPGAWAWVSYDSNRSTGWSVRCAYTSDGGTSWILNRVIASGTGNQFWSHLNCAGYGSRTVRVAYLGSNTGNYRVYYRGGNSPNPTNWASAITISDRTATNTMAPVVTNYGLAADSGDKGIIFYAEPGPDNLWYDADQFAGVAEGDTLPQGAPTRRRGTAGSLSGAIRQNELQVSFSLNEPGHVMLRLYDAGGRLKNSIVAGWRPAGSYTLRGPVPALAAGAYILLLETETQSATGKLVNCR
jgi:hypothetical protein